MADRYDMDRDRDRERERERSGDRNWDRGRDWGREQGRDFGEHRYAAEPGREEWDRQRERGSGERRYGEAGYEDYGQQQRRGGGDEGWRDNRYSGSERVADYGNRGDWGRQGSWGNFGNRPDYNRENDMRESRGTGMSPRRVESDFGGANTNRTNLFGTGGGGFGTGFASYGSGMGNFGGSGSFGGGMSTYGERGRFSGRGPKGWQRSDERIREDVSERLADHPHVDASEIEVTVKQGEVTLTGTVDDRQAKRLAEDITESVSGVREVHNQIRVQQGQGQAQSQPEQQKNTTLRSTTTRNR